MAEWLIDPAELDEFQREIKGFSLAESYLIKGCAGSGKTILALYRANDVRINALLEDPENPASLTVVVYTKVLKSFITAGIRKLKIDVRQVVHYDTWDGDAVDHIVADEVQDFSEEKLIILSGAARKSMMLYGDSQQQLYNFGQSVESISDYLKLPQKELLKNYRLPKSLAEFASYVGGEKNFLSKCVKVGNEKPKLKKFRNWEEELDYIMAEIETKNLTDVGILVPFNTKRKAPHRNQHRNVEAIKEYFDGNDFFCEYKIREDDSDTMELDFDSKLPKVLPFHSSKGLQFDTVFIPFCDYPFHDKWWVPKYKVPLFVALTRSSRSLYITYSETLSPFLNGIPRSKYD